MEDAFEVVVALIVILAALVSKNSKKKKAAAKAPEKTAPKAAAQRAAKPAAQPDVKPAASKQTAIEQALANSSIAEAINAFLELEPKPQEIKSGESPTDEHGCIGGSIGVHEPEGETQKEHAEHERRREDRITAETASARTASELRKIRRTDLRRAVVMSEILDKPVSLRRRA